LNKKTSQSVNAAYFIVNLGFDNATPIWNNKPHGGHQGRAIELGDQGRNRKIRQTPSDHKEAWNQEVSSSATEHTGSVDRAHCPVRFGFCHMGWTLLADFKNSSP
jgi:hypothetical protein